MKSIPINPFEPIEAWDDTVVTVKDGDEERKVDAKRYHVRYVVGESDEKRFVDSGKDEADQVNERTIYLASSIHKVVGEPFHYDESNVLAVSGESSIESSKRLSRSNACSEHEKIEVAFESPGVECCALSKEEADQQRVPLQYLAGYLLGRSEGLFKVAQSKTELDDGTVYYDNIHIIPEEIVKNWSCID
jgi:hypothetical protein